MRAVRSDVKRGNFNVADQIPLEYINSTFNVVEGCMLQLLARLMGSKTDFLELEKKDFTDALYVNVHRAWTFMAYQGMRT